MNFLKLIGACLVSILGGTPQASVSSPARIDTIQAQPKQKQITSQSDFYNSTETYLFVAKNYANNGLGTFYTGSLDSITLTDSRLLGTDADTLTSNRLYFDFTIINANSTQASRLSLLGEASAGRVYLSSVYLSYNAQTFYIYKNSTKTFNRSYCSFIGKNFTAVEGYEATAYNILSDLFNIYTFSDASFTFENEINYNALYDYSTSSAFVAGTADTKIIDAGWFYSNGLAFNQIKIYYIDAYATRYISNTGDIEYMQTTGFSYFSNMTYKNTATELEITVNSRIYGTYTDSSDNVQYYLNNSSKWSNQDYRELVFASPLTPANNDSLSKFNTGLGQGYIEYNGSTDSIGLGSVFTLIGSAFSAVAGFLAIQIMPGLSLGLLLFAPLIVGIIIAVIWIVKR